MHNKTHSWSANKRTPFKSLSVAACNDGIYIIQNGFENETNPNGLYELNKDKQWINVQKSNYLYDAIKCNNIVFNKNKNSLIIINEKYIISFDLKNNKYKYIENETDTELLANFVSLNGNIHQIMSAESNEHQIYSDDMKTANIMNTGDIFENITDGISGPGVISTSNRILVIGGCNIENNEFLDRVLDTIFTFNNDCWQKLNMKLPQKISHFGCVVTRNETEIVIIGGISETFSNVIYIFNIKYSSFIVSSVSCPFKGKLKAVICSNSEKENLLTFGWIRCLFQSELKQLQIPPIYLQELIDLYWTDEEVNVFRDGEHYTIKLYKLYDKRRFIQLPWTASTATAERREFVELRAARDYKKTFRNKYIGSTDNVWEHVGIYYGCTECDQLFYSVKMCQQHFYRKHMVENCTSNDVSLSGKYYAWDYVNEEDCLLCYCLPCSNKRICTVFASSTTCMNHVKTIHSSIYNKLE